MAETIVDALFALTESGIRYRILHGWETLPDHVASDVDLVAAPGDLNLLEQVLHDLNGVRLVQVFQHETSCFYFVLTVPKGRGVEYIPLDVATDYRRDGLIFFSAEELLSGESTWKRLPVADSKTEFGYLLVKKVLKGNVQARQQRRLQELKLEVGEQADGVVEELFGSFWSDRITRWITTGQWTELTNHLRSLRRALVRRAVQRDRLNALRYWIPELHRIWLRWRYPSGLSVAVLGPDGAGKSTLIAALGTMLSGAFRRTGVLHMRPALLRKRSTVADTTQPHAQAPQPGLISVGKLAYYLTDYVLGYLARIRPQLARSTLLLFDRHYADLLVDPRRYRYGGPMGLVRWAQHFIPAPELHIILDLPGATVLQRKQELPEEELRRQRSAYLQLTSRVANPVIVDASQPAEEVAHQVRDLVLKYLRMRYSRRRHIWFGQNWASEPLKWFSNVTGGHPQCEGSTTVPYAYLPFRSGRGYILSLASRQATVASLGVYNAQGRWAKAARTTLEVGLRLGISQLFLRKVRLPDVCGPKTHDAPFLSYLKSLVGRQDITFGASLGTAGIHRKPVIEVLTETGEVLAYVKVGWNEATRELVRNEVQALGLLATKPPKNFLAPQVIHAGDWHNCYICMVSAQSGRAPTADPGSHLARVVAELAALDFGQSPLLESRWWEQLRQQVDQVQDQYFRSVLDRGVQALAETAGDRPLPFHYHHGDFAPWNMRWVENRPFVFDWEYAGSGAPAGFDLIHYYVQTMFLIQKQSAWEIARQIREEVIPCRLTPYLKDLGQDPSCAMSLTLSYLLGKLSFYALYDSYNFSLLTRLAALVHLMVVGKE